MFVPIRVVLAAAWRRLAEPRASIQDVGDRRRARVLSGLLILVAPLPLILLVVAFASGLQAPVTNSLLLGLAVIVLSYVLNRSGHYTTAAHLIVAGIYAAVLMYAITMGGPRPLAYLAITTLVSGLLFRPIATVYHFAFSLVLFALFIALAPVPPAADALNVFLFLATLGALNIVVTFLRQHDLNLIERQTRELRAGDKRMANIVGTASEIIVAIDHRQNIVLFNLAAERSFGYTAAEVMGQKLDRLMPQPFRDAHPQQVADFGSAPEQSHPAGHRVGFNGQRKDGSEFPMEAGISKVVDEGRTVYTFFGSDITERKRAADAVRQSEERYRALIEQAADGIFITDEQGHYLDVNASGCVMLGYAREELIGADYRLILQPDDMAQDPPNFALLLDGRTLKRERTYLRKDGTLFPADISARLLSDGRALNIVRDISERRAADEARHAGEERYRRLAENFPGGVFTVYDTELRVTFVAGQELTKSPYSADHFVGKHFKEMSPPETWQIAEPHLRAALAGHSSSYETPYYDGRWYQVNVAPLQEVNGQVQEIVLASLNVTERKAVEDALRASEAKYRLLVERIHDVIYTLNERGLLTYISPSIESMMGYRPAELTGREIWPFIHRDDLERARAAFAKNLAGETSSAEYRLIGKSSEIHWVRSLSVGIVSEGRPPQVEGVLFDMAERKRTEEALRASEKEFRSLAEAMPQIVWITRADGWNIYFNQHWMEYTGLTLEQSLGHGWQTRFHPDDRQREREAWQNANEYGASYALECRLRRADGVYNWWLIRGVPQLDEHGTVLKWFATCTDIEDLKQVEARLEERLAELQRWQNAMLGREGRILELKGEVNELLAQGGQLARYSSAVSQATEEQ